MKKGILSVLFFLSGFCTIAQLDSYSYYRELKPVAATSFYDLRISASILDRPGSFRVYKIENDTTEIPYIYEAKAYDTYGEKYLRPLSIIDKTYEPGKSYATLVIDTNLTYNSVYVNFNAPEFFKDVTVEGSTDNKNWKTIIENEKVFHYYREPGEHYLKNNISFGTVSFKYLRLKINDANNDRLEIVSAYLPLVITEKKELREVVPAKIKRLEDKKNKQTIIECAFNRKYLVTELNINVENENNFRRDVTVYLLEDSDPKKENWIFYGSGALSSNSVNNLFLDHYNSGDRAFKSSKVKLVVSNLDNAPLDKINPEVLTHQELIKLKLERDKNYVLAYGKDNDAAPQYDLEYFRNSIPLNLESVELGVEKQIVQKPVEKKEPLLSSNVWIWTALLLCVLIIGIFVIKLMKTEK